MTALSLLALRIGINALFLIPGGVGGTEIYLRFLLRSLSHIDQSNDYVVFLNEETGSDLTPARPGFRSVPCSIRASFRPARILFEQVRLPRLLAQHGIDVLLNPGFTAPLFAPCPQVTVFHDLQHKIHPGFFRLRDLPFWNVLLACSAARSRRLIAVSDNTARDLAKWRPEMGGKVVTIPHGVDPAFFEIGKERREQADSAHRSKEADRPFILAVSTLHPHKNLERAIEAFRQFRTAHPEYRLVIVGLKGFATRELDECVRSLGLQEYVEFTGWVPRSDLYLRFRTADAFFAPSLFEGFGLPLVEALAAGIPTACSAIPPFQEISRGIAHMFDPLSISAMRNALETITRDENFRSQAAVEGPKRASMFDWDKTAEATLRELTSAARISRPDAESIQETGARPAPMKTASRAPAPQTSDEQKASRIR